MGIPKHTNSTEVCPSCEAKLLQADPLLRAWFREQVKPAHPDAHISWSFRDEINQNQCVKLKTSKLYWPHSAHNAQRKNLQTGKLEPQAQAIDLFILEPNGLAVWPSHSRPDIEAKFQDISDKTAATHTPIFRGSDRWGWDGDHFQMESFDKAGC